MLKPKSPPGWALAIIAVVTILLQGLDIYDPTAFMKDLGISDRDDARVIGMPSPFYLHKPITSNPSLSWSRPISRFNETNSIHADLDQSIRFPRRSTRQHNCLQIFSGRPRSSVVILPVAGTALEHYGVFPGGYGRSTSGGDVVWVRI